jgi:hypothetical protein
MPVNDRRKRRIAKRYGRLVAQGEPATEATYLLAVALIDLTPQSEED